MQLTRWKDAEAKVRGGAELLAHMHACFSPIWEYGRSGCKRAEGSYASCIWLTVADDVALVLRQCTEERCGTTTHSVSTAHHCSIMAAGPNAVSDDPSSHAQAPVVAFPDFRLFDSAQDILDHNK